MLPFHAEASVKINFQEGDNLTGVVDYNEGQGVNKITLSEILNTQNISDYILVSDIEGSEIEFLMNDALSLNNCKQVFIELHETVYRNKKHTVEEMHFLLTGLGFLLFNRDGNVLANKKGP